MTELDNLQVVLNDRAILGEGARWNGAENALYWVDILARVLHRFDPATGKRSAWGTPQRIGCSAGAGAGKRVLALETGLHLLDMKSGDVSLLQTIKHKTPTHRFNDGGVDPKGRFWVGSMNEAGGQDGGLYCFDDVTAPPRVFGLDWGCPNGMGWSPDGARMYVTDSRLRTIWVFDFEVASGTLTHRRVFAEFHDGAPDGLCVDQDGCVWSAIWDASKVVRMSPQGKLLSRIDLPAQRPTSVALGGEGLRTLYITTAAINVRPRSDGGEALDGALFGARVVHAGQPESVICKSDSL